MLYTCRVDLMSLCIFMSCDMSDVVMSCHVMSNHVIYSIGARFQHEDWCHLCKVGGELVMCNWCPRTYHIGCAGLSAIPTGYFSCPQHSCAKCQRKAHDAGGLLFRCTVCPCSYW